MSLNEEWEPPAGHAVVYAIFVIMTFQSARFFAGKQAGAVQKSAKQASGSCFSAFFLPLSLPAYHLRMAGEERIAVCRCQLGLVCRSDV
jgi:hypothetical protein